MNGLSLSYIGDAYYELIIRKYLIGLGLQNVDILHKRAVKFVSSVAQASILKYFIDNKLVTEEEISIYKRARNATTQSRKHVDASTYGKATGFEAIIGNLYLNNIKRCDELIEIAIKFIEERTTDGK